MLRYGYLEVFQSPMELEIRGVDCIWIIVRTRRELYIPEHDKGLGFWPCVVGLRLSLKTVYALL